MFSVMSLLAVAGAQKAGEERQSVGNKHRPEAGAQAEFHCSGSERIVCSRAGAER